MYLLCLEWTHLAGEAGTDPKEIARRQVSALKTEVPEKAIGNVFNITTVDHLEEQEKAFARYKRYAAE